MVPVLLAPALFGADADTATVEDFETAASAGLPAGWRQAGTWIFGPDLACQVSSEAAASLERTVSGNAWIEAGMRQVGVHFGRCFGLVFRLPKQTVQLERRQNAEGSFAVLLHNSPDREPIEIRIPAPAREVTLRLERENDTFRGWLVGADGSRAKVGELTAAGFGELAQAAVYVTSRASRLERVRLTHLRVGGRKPAPDTTVPVYNRENQFLGFVVDGTATLQYPNGNRYSGGYADGRKQGRGTFAWATGHTYSGDYKDDNMHGTGTYTWPDDGKYTGAWRNGKMDGYGTRIYADGGTYVGQWQNHLLNGTGTRTWPNGDAYVGQLLNGNMQGAGTYSWADGGKYTGAWQAGRMHGRGVRTWPDGTSYDGEFLSDRASGGWYEPGNGPRVWAYQDDDGTWVQEAPPEE